METPIFIGDSSSRDHIARIYPCSYTVTYNLVITKVPDKYPMVFCAGWDWKTSHQYHICRPNVLPSRPRKYRGPVTIAEGEKSNVPANNRVPIVRPTNAIVSTLSDEAMVLFLLPHLQKKLCQHTIQTLQMKPMLILSSTCIKMTPQNSRKYPVSRTASKSSNLLCHRRLQCLN